MSNFRLSAGASADLHDVWDYIARDSVDAADRWVAKLFEAFDLIGRNPRAGHTRKDLTSRGVLFWRVGMYLIVYRPEPPPVEIVAVTQGGRVVPSFLQRRT